MPIHCAMEIDPQIYVFGGSLITILALFALAKWLKLGGKPVLADEATVQLAAGEVEDGFDAIRVSISRDRASALASDQAGRIMVIKRHGNQFAGRILDGEASAREVVDGLLVDCGEAGFSAVRLTLNDSSAWADRINRLSLPDDA